MAIRPIYISTGDINNPVIKKDIEFIWYPGVSYLNKCKRRDNLKKEISKLYNIKEWLEVSTKSDKDLGVYMSALNLELYLDGKINTVEKIYQSSKVYDNHSVIAYKYNNKEYPIIPFGMFYDYIYMLACYQNNIILNNINNYKIFSDIEFNPNKSINTQARAAAIYKTLIDNNYLYILNNIKDYEEYYKKYVKLK